ncbi:MAG: hypothetical protein ACPGVT_00595 [Maricaulaceae bacterium]
MPLSSFLKTVATAALFAGGMHISASAQSIEIGQLGAAQDFDAGVMNLQDGGLDPALWQNTSAAMAEHLLARAPVTSKDPHVRSLIRSAVLSAGVPPQGAGESYSKARLRTVMALSDQNALQMLAERSADFAATPEMRADLALASGDVTSACATADTMREGRSEPYWARLRAFCHITRDEIAAAELTANLLKNSGHEDTNYFALLSVLTGASSKAGKIDVTAEPIYAAMQNEISKASESATSLTPEAAKAIAISPEAKPELRFKALFKAARSMTDADIGQVLAGVLFDKADPLDLQNMGKFDYGSAVTEERSVGFAQLFFLIQQEQNIEAAREFLIRSDQQGEFARFARLIKNDLAAMPAQTLLETDISIFARAAILRGDIASMQSFFRAAEPESHVQARIALAADALGNGFQMGLMGADIETRLATMGPIKARAERDAYIALALGSFMSDTGALELEGAGDGKGRSLKAGDIAAIASAAKAGARAETALRAAILLEGGSLNSASFAAVIDALMEAGLTAPAGKLAARDFLADL